MPSTSVSAEYCTYMSSITESANAFFPISGALASSSAQLFVNSKLSHAPVFPPLISGSHVGDVHPDNVQTVQSGGAPASLLATKHARPTIQMNGEARYGTATRLPQTTQLSCTHGLVLPLTLALKGLSLHPCPACPESAYLSGLGSLLLEQELATIGRDTVVRWCAGGVVAAAAISPKLSGSCGDEGEERGPRAGMASGA